MLRWLWPWPLSKYASTPAAVLRPSEIAHTTSDWPRRISPAAKTPSTEVMLLLIGGHIAAAVERDSQLLQHSAAHRPSEAHGKQHEVGFDYGFGSGNRLELWRRRHLHGMQARHVSVGVALETDRSQAPLARSAFFVRALGAQLQRPQRPRRQRGARLRRLGHDLKLPDACRSLTQTGAETIGSGIAASDDDHFLSGRQN